ncbi:hypothetical protein G6F57_007048 [Rhizopus arrhizus]|nr:hypothetical protein G6F23_002031 [Rhizopus arrhizus]KAG1423475.1 hypothetical protein G6F58_002798 [Rhizopus delemar]KAG0768544.1 hypothetical protein G6F24_001848 [Rhizopus arrhizus]KAG0789171.1 hypothetical protein G6F21_006697 [Rhizopus arrhizus]KAG0816030.1 hypothetical protein G6F20_003526 [Rhizopus arrhizus]
MLESIVASILNRFLKNYVSNLNYDQLKIGIWKGEVNLSNLKLRRDALDKLHLPINVSEGYLGELTLVIPWSNLRSEPVKIIIDHVYLLAEPKSEATLSVEEEEERLFNLKQRRLATAELLDSPDQKNSNEEDENNKSNDGFLSQLTTKVINNLQFTIKNIHIRYEDNISDPGHPFAVGVTLKELSGLSTDDEWQPKFINDPTNSINKLVTLESLSVYWNTDTESLAGMHHEEAAEIPTSTNLHRNHQYLLRPVSGTGKVKLNKKFGERIPKTDVTLLFDEIAFGLDDHQYRDCILMLDLFHSNLKKQKYLKYHPEKGKTAKTHPREYFQFAANAVLSEIHEKKYKWSWDHFRTRRDQRVCYIECYVASKLNEASSEQTQELEKLERILSFEDIRFYRSIAKGKLKKKKAKIDRENKRKKEENAKSNWWGWITGSTNKPSESVDDDEGNEPIHLTEEQRKELYDAIEYEEDRASIVSSIDIPKDTIRLVIKTKLNRGSFTLKKNVKKRTEQELLSLVFNAVSLDVTQYVESIKVAAALGDLQLFDGSSQNTTYRQLIGAKTKGNRNLSLIDSNYNMNDLNRRRSTSITDYTSSTGESNPLFSAVFENKPLLSSADHALTLKMRHLEIIYSAVLIDGIIEFFKPPSSKMESVNALIAVAGDTFEELKFQTRAGLEFALETHTTIDIDIDMDAPIIFIPESLMNENSPVLVIDAGHINIDSELADTKVVEEIKSKDIRKFDTEDTKKLESLMYDKFNLQLTETKILIGSVQECLWQLQHNALKGDMDPRLVDGIDLKFLVELCILPGKTEFTKFKISGHLPLLSVNVSDSKYKTFMKIIDLVIPNTTSQEQDTTQKTQAPVPRASSHNLIQSRFWGDQELLLSDTESETTAISTSTMTSMTVSEAEQFKMVFQVDKVSALLHETCIVDNIRRDELLCEIVLESFELSVLTRPLDLLVDVSLKALNVTDKMEHGNEFHYLVTSDVFENNDTESDKNLISVKYRKASRDHPHFIDVYDGYDQTVDVILSTFTVIVTRSSLLRVYNWIMKTFTSPSSPGDNPVEVDGDVFYDESSSHRASSLLSETSNAFRTRRSVSKLDIPKKPVEQTNNVSRMKVAIHMDSVDLVLNNDGLRLGTLELSFGDLIVMLEPTTLSVLGKFGNFTLSDDTTTKASSQPLNMPASENLIVSVVGEDLADFSYKTYDSKHKDSFPGYDQEFKLRMRSIQVVVTDSLKPTLTFLTEFLEMKSVYDAARNAAVETAQQYQEEGSRFHFDVLIKSPLVVFPVGDKDTIVAHLGEIRAKNQFIEIRRRDPNDISSFKLVPISQIECGLYDISLQSVFVIPDESVKPMERTLPIIDDLDIAFDVKSLEKPDGVSGPNTQIKGKVSDVKMLLTEKQYKSLLKVWDIVQKTFLASPSPPSTPHSEDDDYDNTKGPLSSPQSVASHHSEQITKHKKIQKPKAINLDLCIVLNTICLKIMKGDGLSTENKANQVFSRLLFNTIAMKMQTMSDESMLMEVKMQSIQFSDIRVESKSKFKEILPANTLDGPQFQFKMQSFKEDENKSVMDIQVVVDSPKVILSLDYLMLLKDFFMAPFSVTEPTEAQKFAQSHGKNEERNRQLQNAQQLQEQAPPTVIRYHVNVVDLEVICLASPERESSEAVVLSFDQLIIDQQDTLKVSLDGIGMVLCRMDNRKESTLHFVEQFDISLNVNNAAPNSVHNLISVRLHVKNIILRLSYQDAMLIMTIVNKGLELMGSENKTNENPKSPDDANADDLSGVLLNNSISPEAQNLEKPKSIEPYIVMSKESLTASFEGLQVILIEDLYDLPFIDIQINPFQINASDWTRAVKADVDFALEIKAFNFKNSHWEPLLEPWSFCIKATQNPTDQSTHVVLDAKDMIYFNVTHAFIESALAISQSHSEIKHLSESAQSRVLPYLLVNKTGYDLRFWNMSDDTGSGDTRMYKLENGKSMPWTFRDWKKRREKINIGKNLFGVQIDENQWESIMNISVDREGQFAYCIKPESNGILHRLIIDICLENHIKKVIFRSGLLLENGSSQDMEVMIVDKNRRALSDVVKIKAWESYSVPIKLCFDQWVVVRPSDRYQWGKEMFVWSDVLLSSFPKYIECSPLNDESLMPHLFQIKTDVHQKSPLIKRYPHMKIQFCAPIEIENLLPFDFDISLTEIDSSKRLDLFVQKDTKSYIHSLPGDVELNIQLVLKSDKYKPSEVSTIRTTPNYNSVDEKLIITDHDNVPTNLLMHVSRTANSIDSLYISIYAPYLIINKSGLPISLRPRHSYHQGKLPVESIPAYKEGESIIPAIFSYSESNNYNRSQISIDGSKWSDPISFEAVGNSQDVTLLSKTDSYARHAGIKVEEGKNALRFTKIVTITPRYILKNNMNIDLEFCEFSTSSAIGIKPGQKMALYQTSKSHVRWICLRLQEPGRRWSSPVNILDIGKMYVKVDRGEGEIPYLVRVSVHITDSIIFTTFTEDDEWPYYIINDSSVDVHFAQEDIDPDDYNLKSREKKAFSKPKKFHLSPGEKLKYSWDITIAKEKKLVLHVGNRRRSINFEAVGSQVPFRYLKHRDDNIGSNTLSIDIVAKDTALVLHITDFDLSKSLYRPKSSATSTLASISREDSIREVFETINIQHIINYVFEVKLIGLGISVIDRNAKELAFATIKDLEFKYTDSNMYQSLRLSIEWFQIDNQLYGSTYPILCYPTTLSKVANDLTTHPTLHVALDKVKDDQHGVSYFKMFSFLLQEMTFEADENFLYALVDFAQFKNAPTVPEQRDEMFIMEISEPAFEKTYALYYFEEFCIQPMRLNLSFVRTEKMNDAQDTQVGSRNTPIGYVFNVFTMTLGNINDAPIKLNALMVDNLRASSDDLISRIILHYREQIVYQIHRVLGSIDIFGNPVGLFNTLSSGFGELFYEPYQGFVMSDRPQDLGIGIARGVGGFLKKSIFGVTDSMSRFTGSLGKGLSAATMDKKFQEKRRMNMTRNKPTHAIYGVTHGVGYFGTSIASGVAGLVKRPIEGAEDNGVIGFVEGVGRGLVGAFTKPVVGFFDMASNITAGIRETTTVFEGVEIGRERLPRFVGRDGILVQYSQREALGQMWLKEMESRKFFNDDYIAHSVMENDQAIVILTYQNIIIMQSDDFKMDSNLSLDLIESAEAKNDGVYLKVKKNTSRILTIDQETSREWFAVKIRETLQQRKEERERH